MRRLDKKKNIEKVNLLREQFYLEDRLSQNNDTYFETLGETLDAVQKYAESMGYTLDEEEIMLQFGSGGISYGQTKSVNLTLLKDGQPMLDKRGKPMNRYLHVSIYRMDSGKYELTMYKTF